MDALNSEFFKKYQRQRSNLNIMLREGFEKVYVKDIHG
jgi:hypothetical protein